MLAAAPALPSGGPFLVDRLVGGRSAAAAFVATLIALIARSRHPVAELIRGRGGARAVAGDSAPASGRGCGAG